MKERIKQLLIAGVKPSEIASIVGCSASYVSQLLSDQIFKEDVLNGMAEIQEKNTEEEHIDARMQTLEHRIISAMTEKLPEASLGEMTRALETIHKRQDSKYLRKNPQPQAIGPNGQPINVTVVQLSLPGHIMASNQAPVIELNSNREVIAIGSHSLAPLSSDGVRNLFADLTNPKIAAEAHEAIQEMR